MISDGSNLPSVAGPAPYGWVVEVVIEGRLAWMVQPVPLQSWTWTFDLEKAHVFEREGLARDCRASAYCGFTRYGDPAPSLTVVRLTDEYRAEVAT